MLGLLNIPVSQLFPVNPGGHRHWKVVSVRERHVALSGQGLDEQRL